jgi:hypothetical protein
VDIFLCDAVQHNSHKSVVFLFVSLQWRRDNVASILELIMWLDPNDGLPREMKEKETGSCVAVCRWKKTCRQ